jgi:hypothetical protein
MMGFFHRAAPGYRGHQPQQARSMGALSGFWCGLFGGTPAYRQAGREAETTQPASRCWWQAFPATPQYKTASAEDPEGCVPETPPPDCPDDDPEVYLAEDGSLVW